jgi:hypothetical protein
MAEVKNTSQAVQQLDVPTFRHSVRHQGCSGRNQRCCRCGQGQTSCTGVEIGQGWHKPSRCASQPHNFISTTHGPGHHHVAFYILCPFSSNRCHRWHCLLVPGSSALRRGQPWGSSSSSPSSSRGDQPRHVIAMPAAYTPCSSQERRVEGLLLLEEIRRSLTRKLVFLNDRLELACGENVHHARNLVTRQLRDALL